MTTPIVGIDLGTTHSLVAVLQHGQPIPLRNALGEVLTPSAVSVLGDELVVGAAARARYSTHPGETALSFKRDMGTDKRIRLGNRGFTPQELSACVLRGLKQDAEAALGVPIREAVISVPAYFDDPQRRATREAATLAGLEVRRLINEPTAAALAYGLQNRDRELRAVVLDLGGGTFDVTALEIIEGVIEIQSSAGDTRLGGNDFDRALADLAAARLLHEHDIDLAADPVLRARVLEGCERAKMRLTTASSADLFLPGIARASGESFDFHLGFTREQAEAAWQPLFARLQEPIARALRDARWTADRVDEVLLVGGATRMPPFVRLAAQTFGRMPLRTLPPDEAVALGAAVQAALEGRDEAVDDLVVTDVAPFSLGVSTSERFGSSFIEGIFSPILERGTVIPASRSRSYAPIADDQTEIVLRVYQGEHSLCRDNRFLGSLRVTKIPKGPAGEQEIDVRFSYNPSGLLEVEATVLETGERFAVVLEEEPGQHSPEQVEKALREMQRLKFHPRDALPNTTALARAETVFVELTGDQREHLGAMMAAFRAALQSQDAARISGAREALNALLERMR